MPQCNYCGDPADTQDHVIPHSYLTPADRRGGGRAGIGETVWCCRDCNGRLGSSLYGSMEERCLHIARSLSKKHARLLRAPDLRPSDLEDVGPNLRSALIASDDLKKAILVRIATAFAGSRRHH